VLILALEVLDMQSRPLSLLGEDCDLQYLGDFDGTFPDVTVLGKQVELVESFIYLGSLPIT